MIYEQLFSHEAHIKYDRECKSGIKDTLGFRLEKQVYD